MAERSPPQASPPLLRRRQWLPRGSASSPPRPLQEKRHHLSHVGGAGALCACATPRQLRRDPAGLGVGWGVAGGTRLRRHGLVAPGRRLPSEVTSASAVASLRSPPGRGGLCLFAVSLWSTHPGRRGSGTLSPLKKQKKRRQIRPICTLGKKLRYLSGALPHRPPRGPLPRGAAGEGHRPRLGCAKIKPGGELNAIPPELSLGNRDLGFQDVSCLRFVRDVRNMPPRGKSARAAAAALTVPTARLGRALWRCPPPAWRAAEWRGRDFSPGPLSHQPRRPPQLSAAGAAAAPWGGCPALRGAARLADPAGCRVLLPALADVGAPFHAGRGA